MNWRGSIFLPSSWVLMKNHHLKNKEAVTMFRAAKTSREILSHSDDSSMHREVSLSRHRRPALCLLLLEFILMAIAQPGAAQGVKFTSPVTYPAGAPSVVTAGDFNGDGKMDLV